MLDFLDLTARGTVLWKIFDLIDFSEPESPESPFLALSAANLTAYQLDLHR